MADILRIDLASGAASAAPAPADLAGLGGRGLTSAMVAADVDPKTDPLGPGNMLVIAGGILAGTSVPNSGRLSVGAKSPLTGGIKEANAGGQAARKMANLGIRAIALNGAAPELSIIEVDTAGARLKAAPELAGKGTYDTIAALRSTYGDDVAIVCCGPAGEMQLKSAAVIVTTQDFLPRTASRGGLGAVMGSKKVKAVVINDKGAERTKVADPEALKVAVKAFSEGVRSHPAMGALEALGTSFLINVANSIGCMATNNFSAGAFDDAEGLSGEHMMAVQSARPNAKMTHRCMTGCIVNCSQVYNDDNGKMITSGFEYESLVLLGSNCGISDMDLLAKIDRLCDDVGVDTMEVGAAIGVAMEGGKLPWGDGATAYKLLAGIADGNADSLMIANGCVATGAALGVARVPAVKGQSCAAWEPRVLKGTGVTYATSPQGADHTCGNALPSPTMPDYNPSSAEGQAGMSQFLQAWFATIDTLGLCLFPSLACLDMPELQGLLRAATAAVTGEDLPEDYLMTLGAGVVIGEKAFNTAAGFTAADDRLPAFMTVEALPPSGNVFDVSNADLDSVFAQ